MTDLEFGFSPCPNDTFAFHALAHGDVRPPRGCTIRPCLADIEELNRRAAGPDPLPVTKLSIGALAAVADRYAALPAGAALGRGVGPLVVTRAGGRAPADLRALGRGSRVAIPGTRTTAFLLLRLFAPAGFEPVELRFDRIMPAVAAGEVDAGLVIHESRFTYRDHGLVAIADVGELWERDTGLPLPLAVIAARRDLPRDVHDELGVALRESVEAAFADPARSRAFVRAHSQELSDAVCDAHIALYVNAWSIELGAEGRAAVDTLLARGRALGLLQAGPAPWRE
ncbi:MAG: 1,4-dihydroxy-6-naphthoate synthase [Planctomycetes bacterium]|nr:1,4-dihydroxy-6-naphthoate synthase [Planctomycetota bacterium]